MFQFRIELRRFVVNTSNENRFEWNFSEYIEYIRSSSHRANILPCVHTWITIFRGNCYYCVEMWQHPKIMDCGLYFHAFKWSTQCAETKFHSKSHFPSFLIQSYSCVPSLFHLLYSAHNTKNSYTHLYTHTQCMKFLSNWINFIAMSFFFVCEQKTRIIIINHLSIMQFIYTRCNSIVQYGIESFPSVCKTIVENIDNFV